MCFACLVPNSALNILNCTNPDCFILVLSVSCWHVSRAASAWKKDEQEKSYSDRLLGLLHTQYCPTPPPLKTWLPKHPEISFPALCQEVHFSPADWQSIAFPSFPVPPNISTHVNTEYWSQERDRVAGSENSSAAVAILDAVLDQLTNGVNSGVDFPGNQITISPNYFSEPLIDLPRIADAIAGEIKDGHLAGPLPMQADVKINSWMAIPKPNGHRRQVGNLSSPDGCSFNDGIPTSFLSQWPVTQTTAKAFSFMLAQAGQGAIMSCSDMVAAYKTLPVCIPQRQLQGFSFMGNLFLDLRMVFGDKSACMWYDRLHYAVIHYMVLHRVSFPPGAIGRTVDDVPAVAPAIAANELRTFVHVYRQQLSKLNIGAAPADPNCKKAFDGNTAGEVLGIWFDSQSFTWHLPHEKVTVLVTSLLKVASAGSSLTLHEVQVLHGKLNNFAQMAPSALLLVAELICMLRDVLEASNNKKTSQTFSVPPCFRSDAATLAAIVADTVLNPLPIVSPPRPPALHAIQVFTDASGHLLANPALGIYCPAQLMGTPMIASIPFPKQFLLQQDSQGKMAFRKTTTLEALGLLVPLCIAPMLFAEREVCVTIDNVATTIALHKGRSYDSWATTIIRAARVVASGLGSTLIAKWKPRRSCIPSRVADDLTHGLTSALTPSEVESFLDLAVINFPQPILHWMAKPGPNRALGRQCLIWIREQTPDLVVLRPAPV